MEKKFDADNEPLAQLLREAAEGELQLPDFQRGWVWDDAHIVSLLASISLSYPIGAVMTLSAGNPDVKFRCRTLEGVEGKDSVAATKLLLDGQQRLTSLYGALMSKEPVVTRDSRGRDVQRHYYVDIDAAIGPDVDRETDAIIGVPEDKIEKADFGRRVVRDLSSREREVAEGMFPLDCLFDSSALKEWKRLYQAPEGQPLTDRWAKWDRFEDVFIDPIEQYQVAEIKLSKSTTKEAVCRVFEKVNTGGVTLTVFELLTATFAADDFSLRDDWDRRLEAFREREYDEILRELPATHFLQVVTLLATLAKREEWLLENPSDERPPAVACQRRDILGLKLKDYEAWADRAAMGFRRAVEFLHGEHVFRRRDLPYPTQLVPLAAVLARLGFKTLPDRAARRLRRWFWCGVFGEMYGSAVETRFANDLQDCVAWIDGDGPEPRTIRDSQLHADRLLSLRSRISAAYKGVYALQMKRGARDFRLNRRIDSYASFDHNQVDVHHVFPRKWCIENGVEWQKRDSIVNKTPLSAQTNRSLGGRAPSAYLASIEEWDEVVGDRLDSIVRTHHIHPPSLRADDFDGFFDRRFGALASLIEEAMGKSVHRSEINAEDEAGEAIRQLVDRGESQSCEFKSTGRVNLRSGEQDPRIEWAVLKSIAGFMNADGGTLLIGVADDGAVVGIERDFPFVKHGNRDGWELWLTTLVAAALGDAAPTALRIQYCPSEGEGATVARIDVAQSADKGVYVEPGSRFRGVSQQIKDLKHGQHIFFVRRQAQTVVLSGRELDEYKQNRWVRL